MNPFKIGDRILNIGTSADGSNHGKYGRITDISASGTVFVKYDDGQDGSTGNPSKYYQVIESINNDNKIVDMNLKSLFKNMLRGEPEKSFIQAGIMDDGENLTSDGRDIFMAYLFDESKDDFLEKVVKPLLAAKAEAEQK